MDTLSIPRFSTLAARNSAIASPEYGMMCYVSETDEMYVYKSQHSSWVSAAPRTRYLTADVTNSSTSVFVELTNLEFSVETDSTYYGRLHCGIRGDVGGDIKMRIRGPSGATIRTTFMHQLASIATASTHSEVNAFTLWQSQDVILGTLSDASTDSCTFTLWIDVASTGGDIVFSFVRNASSTNASRYVQDSHLQIWKVK
jgi:hypothetical protein